MKLKNLRLPETERVAGGLYDCQCGRFIGSSFMTPDQIPKGKFSVSIYIDERMKNASLKSDCKELCCNLGPGIGSSGAMSRLAYEFKGVLYKC